MLAKGDTKTNRARPFAQHNVSLHMKVPLLFVALALCAGCAHTHGPFVQDGIRIVPPVTNDGDDKTTESSTFTLFNDGGTKWIKITDAEGKKFDVYIDCRLFPDGLGGIYNTNGIYLMAYPGDSNSVRVVNEQDFMKKIGNFK